MWIRATMRDQRRTLLALALLLGLIGAIALGAAAGARRTASAGTRYRADTLMPEGFVNVEGLLNSGEDPNEVLASVESIGNLPRVTALAPFAFMGVQALDAEGSPVGFGSFVPTDDRLGRTVGRPLVHEGRAADPTAVDEVAVNRSLADALDVDPGDEITIASIADFEGTPGPTLEVTVTGVETTIFDLLNEGPLLHPTPAFYAAMQDEIAAGYGYSMVGLAPGADHRDFVEEVRAIFDDREDVVVQAFGSETPGVQDTLEAQALALGIGAGVFALAAVVIIGQAVDRYVGRIRRDAPVLQAVGMTRLQLAGAAAASVAPAAIGGALLAVALAYVASPFMPIGAARRIEPDRGLDLDVAALAGGAAVLTGLTVLATALLWAVDARRGRAVPVGWASMVARRLPPAPGFGVRRALHPTHAVLSRIGTVAGLAGMVGSLAFGVSLGRLLTTPERYGLAWDAEIVVNPNDSGEPPPTEADLARDAEQLDADPDVIDRATAAYTDGIVLNGRTVAAYGLEPSGFEPTIVAGRSAASQDEITLGRGALDALGLAIGDEVSAAGADGGPVPLRIVGEALFPVAADNGFDVTAGLTLEGFEQLASETPEYRHVIDLRDDADPAAVTERHEDLGVDGNAGRPAEIAHLESIDRYPWAFTVVFGVMTVGAALHGVASGVRSSRREVAVLRVLGFTRGEVRSSIRWWLVSDLGIAFLVAVAIGLVAGFRGWVVVADGLHVATDGLVPSLGLLGLLVLVLLLAALGSPAISRQALRRRPTAALRVE